jgi:cation diffusion facilitator family transporter
MSPHLQGHHHPGVRNEHEHEHPRGLKAVLHNLFLPHSHDPSHSIDGALEASREGVRALKISLVLLLVTTVLQGAVVAISGSVALLADTVHNFSDALTAVPLWIAFILGRRVATRRFTYGYSRAEDLAGLFIVLVVALSAIVAAWQSIARILAPQPLDNVGWVVAAGVIGFLGNEAVAVYRIRVGQRIGSAALVADGVHARADGFTSLAVVLGGIGVLLGFPLADPIVGLVISGMIVVLLIGTIRSVGGRLMDSIEPELVDRAEHALWHVDQVAAIEHIRLRWVGHRLHGDAVIRIPQVPLVEANAIAERAEESVKQDLPNVDEFIVRTLVSEAP